MQVNISKSVGLRVRYLRKKANMSIEDLSFESNVNRNYISDLERGVRNPTIKILERIVTALGISLEVFFKGL